MEAALIFAFAGIIVGGVLMWLFMRMRFATHYLPKEEIQQQYILKEIHDNLQQQTDLHRDDLLDKEQEIRKLSSELSSTTLKAQLLEEKLATQGQEIEALQSKARLEFEQVANRLLEEKSQKFTNQNKLQMDAILQPLRDKIKTFEENIERKYVDEAKERFSLKREIEGLRLLNTQLSQEASNLVNALKGDNKTQGDWGELQLELLLERAGLEKGIHFKAQPSFADEFGKQKRPDFVIELPEGRQLVVDSKVSLAAYERYFNAEEEQERALHLAAHIDSVRRHIKELGAKNYQQLYQIHSPDYVLLFVPIEPAFAVATQRDSKLFLDALDQNIVIVTTSTLLATMRTVAYIWKQERQKKNVLEIAKQSGLLYDKFVGFVDDLKTIGVRLDDANEAYGKALNKLKDSPKYGDTLIGRAEKIKKLGAKTSKALPPELLDD